MKIINEYLQNVDKIEFSVTNACTGKCRHCQNGEPLNTNDIIRADTASETVEKICEYYDIKTVMTFGGEPLLYPGVVCSIHMAAAHAGVENRQVITNGYFSKNAGYVKETVRRLSECGVNDLLLSVDAFHQETIPLEPVLFFAECAVNEKIPIRLSPAWLVSEEDGNPYNVKTGEILQKFEYLHIPVGSGNVIFPSGNALKYLREYFDENTVKRSPYYEDPKDVRTVSVAANGDVLNGNINETDIIDIMRAYRP